MLFNLLQSNSSSLLKLSRHVSCFIRPDGCLFLTSNANPPKFAQHALVPRRNHLRFLDLGKFSLPLHLFCELSINIAGPFCSDTISVEVSPYYNSEKRSLDDSLYLVSWRRDSFTRTKQLDKSYHSSVCYR